MDNASTASGASAGSNTDWSQLKLNELKRAARRQPGENIFDGTSVCHKTQLAGIDVLRLSVAPADKVVPRSYAVLERDDWQVSAPSELPIGMDWQQSMEGTYDLTFPLNRSARCLGLGERFSGLNVRGLVHTLCTTDETRHNESADPLYKAIPFLIVADGPTCYGIFLDSPAIQRWDLDSSLNGKAHIELFTRRGWHLYFIGAGSLPQVIEAYTELTGRHDVPPLWSLGHQQCRWSYPDEHTVLQIAKEFRDRKIPCDTIVLDIDYMEGYRVFTASKERFPNFDKLSQKLDAQDFKVVTIIDPGVKRDPQYPVYEEATGENLVCTTPDGEDFVEEVWPGICVFPDFEKATTRLWWSGLHEWYVKRGIAGIWNDMNEPAFFKLKRVLPGRMDEMPAYEDQPFVQRTPEGIVGHLEVRNRYAMLMCEATYEGLHNARSNTRSFVLSRSGYAGLQRYAAVWMGDNMSWWSHLQQSVPMLLNASLSGLAFCGVDIGGFAGDCLPELLIRWYEVGLFYPFMRNHCRLGDRPQEPWAYGAEVEQKCKHLIETRYRLLPYLYALFYEHARTGAPIMRPLCWHYPDDQQAWEVDDQFMFGRDILVAPVMQRDRSMRAVYFPKGRWYPFEGGEPIEGGRVQMVKMPLGSVPAFVREGAIIPLCDVVQSTRDYSVAPITLVVYGEEAKGVFVEDDGCSLEYREGCYNEWALAYHDGRLHCRLRHEGFVAPPRQFFLQAGGRRTAVKLQHEL